MIAKVLLSMIQYFGTDGRRINHALKVYGFASTICRNENLNQHEIEVIEIAAILHDIGIPEAEKKYGSCIGKYQELEGPPIARDILKTLKIKPETIERVCYLIGHHHTYTKIDGIDFQILIEADFLVNIFEDAMPENQVKSIKNKYFKTTTGIAVLETIFK
jgi:HD superfamily phosphodiesterase